MMMSRIWETIQQLITEEHWEEFLMWAFGTTDIVEPAIEDLVSLWNGAHPDLILTTTEVMEVLRIIFAHWYNHQIDRR